ncbi:hypothetical protein [Paraglaciecola sp. 20A4]|uniref:Cap15 family cyclic dinucleotide receptor domain-containing protein n=1 Tax=Paraglaciecola sp. 20A4 TaxID=2687288 RepID=UPI00140879FA|nr:hypothetical protein [Paraglaciecola sp. 20A4]
MFRIVRFDLLVRYVALLTIAISLGVYSLIQEFLLPNFSLFKIVTISSIVSTFIIVTLLSPSISRKLWALKYLIDKSSFPDLNGTWEGVVTLENGGTLPVKAVIRQSLLNTQIDMHGETTKSITLETTPTLEQGQRKLYYVYRSTPKNPGYPSYNGSTLFDIRLVKTAHGEYLELSGNYYTDRKSIGRIAIKQIGTDFNIDVSYY